MKPKKIAFLIISLFIISSTYSYAESEFSYNKKEVNAMFEDIENKPTGAYQFNSNVFQNDSTEFTIYDLEIQSFCTGLCCGPVGLVTIVSDHRKSKVERNSYWIGCSAGTGSILLVIPLFIISSGGSCIPFF